MELVILSIQVVIVTYVYCEVLITSGNLLHPFYLWLTDQLSTVHVEMLPDNTPEEVKALPGYQPRQHERVYLEKRKILKALGDCPLCTAGQFSLWAFLLHYILPEIVPYYIAGLVLFIGNLIFFICLGILLMMVLQKTLRQWQN